MSHSQTFLVLVERKVIFTRRGAYSPFLSSLSRSQKLIGTISVCVIGRILRLQQWVTYLYNPLECGQNVWLVSSQQNMTKVTLMLYYIRVFLSALDSESLAGLKAEICHYVKEPMRGLHGRALRRWVCPQLTANKKAGMSVLHPKEMNSANDLVSLEERQKGIYPSVLIAHLWDPEQSIQLNYMGTPFWLMETGT
jgi:hypothetical protein